MPRLTIHDRRGRWVAGLAASLLAAPLVFVPAQATSSFTLTRLAGSDRFGTAQQVATKAFASAATAIMATGFNFPDALAASFLAGNQSGGAPILLTTVHDPIPAATMSALSTLKVKNVIIVGGSSAVGDDVQSTLAGTSSTNSSGGNLNVSRIAGATRYDTMQAIDTASGTTVGTFNGKKTAFIATGQNFPDALGAGPVAYAEKFPIILTETSGITSQTQSTLSTLGIQQVMILGGTAAVSSAAEKQINAMGIPTVHRFAGANRSDTSKLLADYAITNFAFKNTAVDVASGDQSYGGADALTSGSLGGTLSTPTIITNTVADAGQTTAFAAEHQSTLAAGFALGGTAPLPDSIVQAIEQAGGNALAVSMNSTTTQPGGSLTGTVAKPSTVKSLTASGCGVNGTISFNSSTGAFTVTIPASQPTGTCTLTFTVTYNNGTPTATQSFTITVTNSTATFAAPTLTGVAVSRGTASDTATFTFNQALSTGTVTATGFRLYRASGAFATGQSATAATDGWTVSFPAGSADTVTLGAVRQGSTFNTSNEPNFPGSVPVTGVTATSVVTNEPDLVSVSSPVQVSANATGGSPTTDAFRVTFTFDKPFAVGATPVSISGGGTFCEPTDFSGGNSKFGVFKADGTPIGESSEDGFASAYTQQTTGTSCPASATAVVATFAGLLSTVLPVQAAVGESRVGTSGSTFGNPAGSEPLSSTSAPTWPTLVSAKESYSAPASRTTTNVVFTFSKAVGVTTISGNPFHLILGNGNEAADTSATVSSATVTATFASTDVANAVGVVVDSDAFGSSSPQFALTSGLLSGFTPSTGPDAIPLLFSVQITKGNMVQGPTVVFTFNQTAIDSNHNDYHLFTTAGSPVAPQGSGNGTVSGTTVTFACALELAACSTGWNDSQLTGIVAGGVQDGGASNNPPYAIEGANAAAIS